MPFEPTDPRQLDHAIAIARGAGALLAGMELAGEVQAGSALKFCLVARGYADAYPRAGRAMEWGTAAGHAVLMAAGGSVVDRHWKPLTYSKPGFDNPSFVAFGAAAPRRR